MAGINQELLEFAQRRFSKKAFVPSDQAAQAAQPGGPPGGAPPGGPPGGAPPGGPPPGGPSPGGAPPMPPPPMDSGGGGLNDIDAKVQSAVQNAMSTMGAGGAGGAQGGGMKPPKPDINTVATDVFQLKKMILADMRQEGKELPPDILDGPNRDPMTGSPSVAPTGGSDPAAAAAATQGAIPPISPIQPAMPGGGGGGGKQASAMTPTELVKQAADLCRIWAIWREQQSAPPQVWGAEEVSKVAVADAEIYGTAAGPGEPFGQNRAAKVTSKAAAVLSVFQRKRQRTAG